MNPLTCPLALKMWLRHLEHHKIPVWSPSLQSLLYPQSLWAQASSYHSEGKHPARIPSSTVDWTLPRSANLSLSSCEHSAYRRAGSLWAFGQFQWTKTLEDGNSLCYKWAVLAPFPIWNQRGGCFSQPPILLWAISQTSTLFMCIVDSANPWCFLALSQYSSAHCDPFLP